LVEEELETIVSFRRQARQNNNEEEEEAEDEEATTVRGNSTAATTIIPQVSTLLVMSCHVMAQVKRIQH